LKKQKFFLAFEIFRDLKGMYQRRKLRAVGRIVAKIALIHVVLGFLVFI